MNTGNIFKQIPENLPTELIEALEEGPGVRIERIVSRGHASPPGFWYDQDRQEWVLLICGAARLEFENHPEPVTLKPGDHIRIPARVRHRVAWTAPDHDTVWLAVWFDSPS